MNTSRRSSARVTSAAFQRSLNPEEPEPVVKKFFKIIFPSTLEEKAMKVPARFVRLGPKLCDKVTIETPVGFKRSIRIKRIGDDVVWFGNGWSEFVEAHCLSEGHCLYFHYKGSSSFVVVIFDVSASEIDYPLDKKVYVIESDDDDVMEVVDDHHQQGNDDNDDSSEGVIVLDDLF